MKRFLKTAVWTLILVLVTVAGIVGCWRPGVFRGTPNDGHQLGGDLLPSIPGNTLESLEAAMTELEPKASYLYSECDVRETKDNQLVVFHDWDISSVPNTSENQAALGEKVGKQAVSELTLEQLQSLRLKGGCQIPTLNQVLDKAIELEPKKPLLLEIKYLHSDSAREELLESAKRFRESSKGEVHFLAFIRNIKRSFPQPEESLAKFSENGFRVYQVFRPKTKDNDLCETWK